MWTYAFHMSRKEVKTIDFKYRDGTILTYINDSKQKNKYLNTVIEKIFWYS